MNKRSRIIGAILAGGKSSRMGQNKALLNLNGKSFIHSIASVLRQVFRDVIIISDHAEPCRSLGLPVYPDIIKNCGPLSGVHSAFVHSSAPEIFVTSCDIPFISKELVEYIVDFDSKADVSIPFMNGKLHPLCALYTWKCFSFVEKNLKNKRFRLMDILKDLQVTVVPITPDLFFYRSNLLQNFNELIDYQNLIQKGLHC